MNNEGKTNDDFAFDSNFEFFGEPGEVSIIEENPKTKEVIRGSEKKVAEPKTVQLTEVDPADDDDDFDLFVDKVEDDKSELFGDTPKTKAKATTQTSEEPKEEPEEEEDEGEEEGLKKPVAKQETKKEGKGEEKPEKTVIPAGEVEAKEFFTVFAKDLKARGIISADLPEDAELDEDEAFDLIDQEVEARVDDAIQGFIDEATPMGKDFLRYLKGGGNSVQQFLERYSSTELLVNKEDLDTQDKKIKFLKTAIKRLEHLDDEDDIDDRITFMKDNGKIDKYTDKYYKVLHDADEKNRQEAVAAAEQNTKAQEERRKQNIANLGQVLSKGTVKDVKLTTEDQKTLTDYIYRPSVKVGQNQYVSQLWNDFQAALKNPEDTILLAKFLKSKFDISGFERQAVSKQTKAIKSGLQHYASGGKKVKGVGQGQVKSLDSFFDD